MQSGEGSASEAERAGQPEPEPRAGPEQPLSLRPFYAGFWFGGFNGLTWMVGLGTPMILLAERLGATPFQVGLASSFLFLALPVQLVATTSLRRLGFKRQMVLGWLARATFLLVPLALAWMAPDAPRPWMASALVASVLGFCVFRAFGSVAHLPWFSAFLPVLLRGRYFATDHAITSVVGVVTLLSCSVLFSRLPGYDAFRILYTVAVAGALLAVWNLLRLPHAPAPAATPLRSLAGESRRLCLRPGPFRHYLVLMLLGSIVTSSLGAFTVYYLKVERDLAASSIMIFTAAQFGGQIVGAWGIRHLVDRFPIRRFFQASVLLIGIVDAFWLVFVLGDDAVWSRGALVAVLCIAYGVLGAGHGIGNATHFTYLPELSEERKRHVAVAVFTAAHGLLAGLAPMLWGLALERSGARPGMDVSSFAIYFGLGLALSLLLAILYARLPETREFPRVGEWNPRASLPWWWRRGPESKLRRGCASTGTR